MQASDTLTLTLDVPFTFTVSFRMVQPNPFGKPLGEAMAGVYDAISNPSGTYRFPINNQIGTQTYFVPYVTNRASAAGLMMVNGGLPSEFQCDCTTPPNSTNVAFGYFKLVPNSNVRAYRVGSGYSGPFAFWGYDRDIAPNGDLTPFVEAGTGITRLNLSSLP